MEQKILYIVPTVGRRSISRSIRSIIQNDPNPTIVIAGCKGVDENRNLGLSMRNGFDWVVFLDDDDYFCKPFLHELDPKYDIVVLRMRQSGRVIPDYTNELRYENVGINIAVKNSFLTTDDKFAKTMKGGEDWKFFEGLLMRNPKVYVTDEIYYRAPKQNKWAKK